MLRGFVKFFCYLSRLTPAIRTIKTHDALLLANNNIPRHYHGFVFLVKGGVTRQTMIGQVLKEINLLRSILRGLQFLRLR